MGVDRKGELRTWLILSLRLISNPLFLSFTFISSSTPLISERREFENCLRPRRGEANTYQKAEDTEKEKISPFSSSLWYTSIYRFRSVCIPSHCSFIVGVGSDAVWINDLPSSHPIPSLSILVQSKFCVRRIWSYSNCCVRRTDLQRRSFFSRKSLRG